MQTLTTQEQVVEYRLYDQTRHVIDDQIDTMSDATDLADAWVRRHPGIVYIVAVLDSGRQADVAWTDEVVR